MQIWLYTLVSVLVVSAVSLVGILTLPLDKKNLDKMLIFLVSFAAGSLLGDAFIHLIPESFDSSSVKASAYILSGVIFFFVLEKLMHWRHCHEAGCPEHSKVLPYVILAGDGLHNFIDGVIIGASFLVDVPTGIATTLAVVLHEIPQEIGDFGALIYGGFSRAKALLYNFLSALTAFVGAALVLVLSAYGSGVDLILVPFAAGGFIYIALADIIPELHRHKRGELWHSTLQLAFFIAGMAVMYGLLLFE